jgi:serine/threonine protein kinase
VAETNNHLNIVMEYLEGINLGNYLNTQPDHHASENNAKVILRALTEGLTYLHERQISHRDIKL